MTGTLRDYLAAHDDLPTGPLRTTSPAHIPAAGAEAGAGNHFTTIWIDLPVHLPDPARAAGRGQRERHGRQGSRCASRRHPGRLSRTWATCCCPGWSRPRWPSPGPEHSASCPPTQNLTISTVIGSAEPRYLATRKITHMYARTILCPPINLFICSYTYAGIIDFSITTIEQAVPRPRNAGRRGYKQNSIGSSPSRTETGSDAWLEGKDRLDRPATPLRPRFRVSQPNTYLAGSPSPPLANHRLVPG